MVARHTMCLVGAQGAGDFVLGTRYGANRAQIFRGIQKRTKPVPAFVGAPLCDKVNNFVSHFFLLFFFFGLPRLGVAPRVGDTDSYAFGVAP